MKLAERLNRPVLLVMCLLALVYVGISLANADQRISDVVADILKLGIVITLCVVGFVAGREYFGFTRTTPIFLVGMFCIVLLHVTELTEEFAALESVPLLGGSTLIRGVFETTLLTGSLCLFLAGNYLSASAINHTRRQLESNLRDLEEREQRYRSLFEGANDAIFIIRGDQFVHCNSKTLAMFGCTEEQIIGETPFRFSPPSQPDGRRSEEKGREKLAQALAGEPQSFEWRHIRLDGTPFDAEISLSLVSLSDGPCIQAIVRDVTERRTAEAERARLTAILESTSDVVSTCTPEGQLTYVNNAGRRILGWAGDEAACAHSIADAHPEWALRLIQEEGIPAAIEAGRWSGETAVLGRGGAEIPVSQVIMAHASEGGEVEYMSTIIRDLSERKRTVEALRESEERFRDLYENAPNAYFSIGADGCLRTCNRRAGELLGYGVDELIGRPVMDLYAETPDGKERAAYVLRQFRDGRTVRDEELQMQRADGSTVWISLTVNAVRDAEGRPVESRSMVVDITERKFVEKALRESTVQLQSVFDSSPLAIAVLDLDGNVLDCNQATVETFGLSSKADVLGHSSLESVAEGERAHARSIVEDLLQSGSVRKVELTFVRDDETVFPGEAFATMMRDRSGRPLGLVVALADITERKRAERALRESEAKMRSVFRAAPTGIGVVSNRVLLDVNDRLCEMIGYGKDELIGQSARILYPSDAEYDYVGREKYRQIQDRGTGSVETRMQRKDGTVIDVLLSSTPLDAADRSGGVTFTALDITERKRAEETIRAFFDQSLVMLCIADTQEARLIQVNKEISRITGRSEAELLSCSFLEFIHPDDRDSSMQVIAQLAAGEPVVGFRNRHLTADGEARLFEWTAVPDVERGLMYAMAQDITERERVEKALRRSERLLRESQEVANIGHYALNAQTGCWESSEILDSIFGIGKDFCKDIEGWLEILHPDHRDEMRDYMSQNVLKEHQAFDREYRIVRLSDGATRWVWGLGRLELGPDGTPLRMIGTIQDITVRKEAEQRLLAYQGKLRSLASELSLAEERERRRIAIGLHDDACQTLVLSKMKLQELGKPLSAGDVEEIAEICKALDGTLESVRELVFDLSSPTLYKFGLEAALEELLHDKLKSEHGIRYRFHNDDARKPLAEDVRILLYQSVRELLINTIKHARARAVSVDIARCGDCVRITVSDDGVGFDVEEILAAAPRRRGFGLFSIKERLDHIGGSLDIDSQVGRGSRFTLTALLAREMDGAAGTCAADRHLA